jgi:hypothetical protein
MITIFCDFRQKLAFFSKNNVLIKILDNLALFGVKKCQFFTEFFGENISKIITSVRCAKKWRFFLKTNIMMQILQKFAAV